MVPFCFGSSLAEHYDVRWAADVPITISSAFISAFGSYRYSQMEMPDDVDVLEKSRLFPWDRPIAGRYSETADKLSDWTAVLGVTPLVLGGVSWYRGDATGRDFAAFSLMFTQALLIQNGINLFVRSLEIWPRPYIYATEGDGQEKAESAKGEAYGSFFSGHASAAFTVAVFTGEWFSEMYPNSPYRKIVWATSLSAASLVGVLRIAAGKHYPSDVAVGALVGTGVSLAIIKFHKQGRGASLYGGFDGFGVIWKF